jgi:hypothetical protein
VSEREPSNAELLAAINAGRAETSKLLENVQTSLDGIREDLTVLGAVAEPTPAAPR